METKTYISNSEFRKSLMEDKWSPNKPQIDPSVIKNDAQNNTSAVDDILKQTSEYCKAEETADNKPRADVSADYNKSLLDLDYTFEPGQAFKDRVMAQVKGYPSVQNEKTSDVKDNESLDYSGNETFLQAVKDRKEKQDKAKTDLKHSGLTAREFDRETFEPNTVFGESKTTHNDKKMKRLQFKRSFLNEEDVYNRIPEDFKTVGNRFVMSDREGNEFLIECKEDSYLAGFVHPEIVSAKNPQRINEMFDRMDYLAGYNSADHNKSTIQETENGAFVEMLECTRRMKGDSTLND